jgi:hypothetical protein
MGSKIRNIHILPDDPGGHLAWKLTAQGYFVHDVSYLIGNGALRGRASQT